MSHRNIDRKGINHSKLPKGSRTVYPGSSAAYGGTLRADRGFLPFPSQEDLPLD